MKRHLFCLSVGCLLIVWTSTFASAQQPITGAPPLSSSAGGPFDAIDLANLDVHFSIPVFSRAGKGISFFYNLTYDSLIWAPVTSGITTTWVPATNWGWAPQTSAATGHLVAPLQIIHCYNGGTGTEHIYGPFTYVDPSGTSHLYNDYLYHVSSNGSCPDGELDSFTDRAQDGSGMLLSTQLSSSDFGCCVNSTVTTKSGVKFSLPNAVTDPNGNTITINTSGVITDTLGTTALTVTGIAPNPVQYQYTAPSTGTASVTVTYHSYTVTTQFGVPGIGNYSASGRNLVDRVTLPDGSYYQFYYETTGTGQPYTGTGTGPVTARIAEVRLPTGGTITYTYGSTNSMMADGSPSTMTRALSGGTWTYNRAEQPNESNPQQTWTAIADPSNNITDIFFSGIYQTAKSVYNGNRQSGWLDYSYICYDGATSGCSQAILNLSTQRTERTVYDLPNNGSLYSKQDSTYDQYGNLLTETDYNFATSNNPVLRQVITSYNAPTLCATYNICDHPSSAQIKDGTGTSKSYTTYTYDEDGHTHGSATTISRSSSGLTSGPFLVQHYSYNPDGTGTLVSATDPNGTVTTYSPTSCNNSFPTTVTVQGLTTNYTYNCAGGVVTSVTDQNNAQTQTKYTADPYYWRPERSIDATGKSTYYSYYPTLPVVGQVEAEMTFNSNGSTWDFVTTPDSYGRLWLQQKREGVGWTWFDTTDTEYDASGRVYSTTVPFSCQMGAGQNSCTAYKTTTVYDGFGRPTLITAADGGTTSYSYQLNDAEVTVGPAPSGEHTKSRQLEYDTLGRVTSVCELLPSGGGSSCVQSYSPGNGYLTTYTYDPLGNLLGVNQNGQTRSYTYDGLSRMLSESNAESGATSYTYDSVAANYCAATVSYSSPGDLVAKADANGNHLCYYYDGLHRLTNVGNNHQSATSPCKRFRYDNSTGFKGSIPPGITLSNYWGRLVEAATDNCGDLQNDPLITDEWFSYSPRGETKDFWEKTPNSSGYYHVSSTYWDNGALNTLSGIPSVPTITYGLNTGARIYTVSAATGQNPVTYAAYNAAAQVHAVTYGSGDSDAFAFDPYTGRQTQYQFVVGASPQTVQGDLAWNLNGTLKTLAITDPPTPSNAQTCTYGYDDLARVGTVNCLHVATNVWNQIFTYDAFGNITKTVPTGGTGISFQPTYAFPITNRILSLPGAAVSYDADGNLQSDADNEYGWNVESRLAQLVSFVDGTINIDYDAFGRMAEQVGTTNTQILYSPTGGKVALMNGQNLRNAFISLPGGGQAVYASTGTLSYYRHSDWLGSSRLGTTSTRTVSYDAAYAPFGENYNETGIADRLFTGQTQGTAIGIYDFLFRQQNAVHGRWLVPDPAGLAAVDITNPQTWNRYAYVGNNPMNSIDLLGLQKKPGEWEPDPSPDPDFYPPVNAGVTSNWGYVNVAWRFEFRIDPGGNGVGSDAKGNAANNGPLVLKNPCSVQGRALPPGAYATQGQQANGSTVNYVLDVAMGWPKGDYLDPQPLASGNRFQNQAYGNYVFGVYMSAAGTSLNSALNDASAFALASGAYFTYRKNGYQMDPNYPLLPAANVANITNGWNAQANGTVCHN